MPIMKWTGDRWITVEETSENEPEYGSDQGNLDDILSPWPDIEPSQEFSRVAASWLPRWSPDPPPAALTAEELEQHFRRWSYLVRQHYPEHCDDNPAWVRAGLVLLVRYGNTLSASPRRWTGQRQELFTWLFERFEAALAAVTPHMPEAA